MSDTPISDPFVPVTTEDVTETKEQRILIPPCSNIIMSIENAKQRIKKSNYETEVSETNPILSTSLSLRLKLVEGINEEGKYKNMNLFQDVLYWADKEKLIDGKKETTKNWYNTGQHLLQWKLLCGALDVGYKSVTVDEEFVKNLIGKKVLADIKVDDINVYDQTKGDWVPSGDQKNIVVNFKKFEG